MEHALLLIYRLEKYKYIKIKFSLDGIEENSGYNVLT